MDVILLLADSAQVDGSGKLHALGIGWDQTGSPTAPSSVVALIRVPWNETNTKHVIVLQLRDADGHVVRVPSPIGEQAIESRAEFEVGRPPGVTAGTEQTVKLAPQLGPLPLSPGRYAWHAEIDGQTEESWIAPFDVVVLASQRPRQ